MAKKDHRNNTQANEHYARTWMAGISATNRTAFEQFHLLKLGQGARSGTRARYARAALNLDRASQGKPWTDLTPEDISRFLAGQRLAGYSENTIRSDTVYLKAFLKWARNESALPPKLNLAFKLLRNRSLPERPVLKPEEERALMAAAPTLRDQVIVGLLVEGGWRINELVNLDVGSVEFDDKNGCWFTMPHLEEGHKTGSRRVYLAKYPGLLRAYLTTHPDRDSPSSPLLLAYDFRKEPRSNVRLGTQGIWTCLNRLQKKTGLRHFRPHDLRHTSATRASEAGLNFLDLCERYGWSKTSRMPAHYAHHSQAHKEAMARKAAGVDEYGLIQAGSPDDAARLRKLLLKVFQDAPSATSRKSFRRSSGKPPNEPPALVLITSRGYWARLQARQEWLFERRQSAEKFPPGSRAIVYVTAHGGQSAFGGIVEAVGTPTNDAPAKRGLMDALYPWRVPIRVLKTCEPPLPLARLRSQLSFLPKGPSWGGALQGQPVKRVPLADFEKIAAAMH